MKIVSSDMKGEKNIAIMAAAKLRKNNLTLSENNSRLRVEEYQAFSNAKRVPDWRCRNLQRLGLKGFRNDGRAGGRLSFQASPAFAARSV